MKSKRILSLLLSLVMILSLLPTNIVFAETDTDNAVSGDEDSQQTVYEIGTAEQLKAFRDSVNEGKTYAGDYIKLTGNIDLDGSESDQWTPIGLSVTIPFKGTFDGNGHKISGLYINTTSDFQGLFGYIKEGEIKNLSVSGTVKGSYDVGGIVGNNNSGKVINCCNSAEIVSTNSRSGGVAGRIDNSGIVINCFNEGKISGGYESGGVVGCTNYKVENCWNIGTVNGKYNIGGVVGYSSPTGITSNCYNTGEVTATEEYAGGVVGCNLGNVKNCYNIGTINHIKNNKCGGVTVNFNSNGKMADCYYLEGCNGEKTTFRDEKGKTSQAVFDSGEIAYKLQSKQTEKDNDGNIIQVWGQNLTPDSKTGKIEYPVLSESADKKVNKVTFILRSSTSTEPYAEKYANKTLLTFPAEPPATDQHVFKYWSQSEDLNGAEFDKNTVINSDITVYAVGNEKQKVESTDLSDKIKLTKNKTIVDIDLNDYIKSGTEESKNKFSFSLSDNTKLPDGLELKQGKITGKPTQAGIFTITFNVINNNISLMSLNDAGTELTLTLDIGLEISETDENTYLISDIYDLEYLRDDVNSGNTYENKYIRLENDIDMSEKYGADAGENKEEVSWTPIGRYAGDSFSEDNRFFKGTFDGAGHKISKLYINSTENYQGLFSYLSDGTIKNLSVSGNVTASKISGLIAGGMENGDIAKGSLITNCCSEGEISGDEFIGGIVGYILGSSSKVINCYNTGTISGNTRLGGIAGCNYSKIANCYNTGTISGSGEHIGGIVGNPTDKGSVSNCFYLDGCNSKDTTFTNAYGEKMSKDAFKSGEVTYKLQSKQIEKDDNDQIIQIWGQKIVNTASSDGVKNNDEYPVLTNDAAKKVYTIEFYADDEGKGSYKLYGDNAEYANTGDKITTFPEHESQLFRGWSETENGEKITMPYTFSETKDIKLYSIRKNPVTFEVTGTKQSYLPETPRTVTVVPYADGLPIGGVSEKDIAVRYYEVNENSGNPVTLKSDVLVNKTISSGKYLYVIDLASEELKKDYYIKSMFEVDGTTLPEDIATAYDNVGFMYITSGIEAAQKPVYFDKQIVNVRITDSVDNKLNNENQSSVTYESTDKNVAEVDKNTGKVTVKGAGSTVIMATSHKDGTSDVYASYTLNVTKEVITVTANDNAVRYGDAFSDSGYSISKDGVTLGGKAVYTTDYRVGDGIGKYEIGISGLTSDIYEIEYKSGKLTVGAKKLTLDDIDVEVSGKSYDASTDASVTASVKEDALVSGDKVTVLISGAFEDAGAGTDKTVNYEITGLSGKDSGNYVLSGSMIGKTKADIQRTKVTFNIPASTAYVYDGEAKSVNVIAYANGMVFEGYKISYLAEEISVAEPKSVGRYTVVIGPADEDTAKNYEFADINAVLIIRSAQQDIFSIEGISDTVTYGDKLTLQAAGAIEGGTVTYEIVSGSEYVTLDGSLITTKGAGTVTVKATSKKANYSDKTATRTFVIKPKTITVTAKATDRAYNGSKDVDVKLEASGVLKGDKVSISKISAAAATADVENNKTVFVNGLSIDNSNYQLASSSVQTTVNITKAKITKISMTAEDKVYDGTVDAQYKITELKGVIDADKDFVTVTGTASFNSKNVTDADKVTLTDLVLSGTKSGNYELDVQSAEASAKISKAVVNFTFGALSYVYDGKEKTVPVTAALNGRVFDGYTVMYGGKSAQTNVGKYDIVITLNDSDNYSSDYKTIRQLEILTADQSAMTVTGLPGTTEYGREFMLSAAGGSSQNAVRWSSSDPKIAAVDETTGLVKITGIGEVTVTAVKAADGNFKEQSASVTFTAVRKSVSIRITDLDQTYDGSAKSVKVTTAADSSSVVITYFDENGREVDAPKDAGKYYVEVSAVGNYEGEQSAVLTIKKAKLNTADIRLVIPEDITYGDTYSVSSTYSGKDATITYTGTGIYAEQTEKPVNAGSYMAVLTISNDNYEIATVTQRFDIKKKKLTAKADDKERAYGKNDPEFTVTLTGFAYDDDESDILMKPSASSTADILSGTGSYDIVPQGGYADNYYFDYVNGTLTISQSKDGNFYILGGDTAPHAGDEFTLTAYYNNERPTVEWTSSDSSIAEVDKTTGKVKVVGVGEVTITAHMKDERFDNSLTATFRLTASKKHITLAASASELVKVYNGEEQYIKFTAGQFDLSKIKIDTMYVMTTDPKKTVPKDAGTYAVSYIIDDEIYEGSGNFTLVINKADVTVSADAVSKEYGDEPVYKLKVSENVKGINAETLKSFVTFTSDGAAKTAGVGEYDINVALTKAADDNCNYTADNSANGKLIVTKATLNVNVEDVVREYGAENPAELKYTITGFKNGETADVLTGSVVPRYSENIVERAGTQKDVITAVNTLENANYNIVTVYADGNGADLIITKIKVTASVGTAKSSYITIKFDRPLEGLTVDDFIVKDGENTVALTGVTASDDKMTYTLNGTFSTDITYIVTPKLISDTHEIISGPLSVKPSGTSGGSSGGGGGGTPSGGNSPSAGNDGNGNGNEDGAGNGSQNEWEDPFTDVSEDDWFFEYVKYVNENGLMSGVTADRFAPGKTLTRAMLVTVLYRAEGEPASEGIIPFTDVTPDSYYADAVVWAAKNGIVKGVSETKFAPDQNVTREQIAAIIYRYAEYKGIAPAGAWAVKLNYSDTAEISDYAVEGVMYCSMKGIMQGKNDNMFAPKANATRAEIAAILNRFIEGNRVGNK